LKQTLLFAAPAVLAACSVALFDRGCRRRGLDPPGSAQPVRRIAGLGALGLVLWIGVFFPISQLGTSAEIDFASIPVWQLFLVHALLVGGLLSWFVAGHGLAPREPYRFRTQLGLAAPNVAREMGIGLVVGVAAWMAVLLAVLLVALAVAALGGGELLPTRPPPAIPWLASQPVLLRLALAASAGVVEELFFRGLLQPRAGLVFATALFACAHLSYDQPFLLVGVTLLSIVYGLLVRWRQSLWAAVVAHFVFDAIQLLVVIPLVLERSGAVGT